MAFDREPNLLARGAAIWRLLPWTLCLALLLAALVTTQLARRYVPALRRLELLDWARTRMMRHFSATPGPKRVYIARRGNSAPNRTIPAIDFGT